MIEINNRAGVTLPVSFLKKLGEQVLEHEGKAGASLSLALVDSKKARQLNLAYRKKSYVPNVLSFKAREFGLGEIVLCPEQISKDATRYGILFTEELSRVFIHGMLHVLGYSHSAMKKKEDFFKSFWRKRTV